MIINHNMQAINAHRQLGINSTNQSKSMEKLSSGLRINRAGDDAAGLSISEKMRGQIRGLDQASRNAQDGVSLIQTAEGALDETHSILQRMRELTVQAANDTNIEADRKAINEELTQLTSEIDRIAETTQFNKQTLLDGSFSGKFQIGANNGQTISLGIGAMTSSSLGIASGVQLNTVAAADSGNENGELSQGTYKIDDTLNVVDAKGNVLGVADEAGKITLGDGTTEIDLKHAVTAGSSFEVQTGGDIDITLNPTLTGASMAAGDYTVSGTDLMNGNMKVGELDTTTATKLTLTDGTEIDLTEYGLVAADLADGSTFTVKGIDVTNSDSATGSITTLAAALEKVSEQRSKLGATQNRLEHTINNLNNASENLTAAESRIRDVDMAKEMMESTKSSILSQAAQAMLAQEIGRAHV